MIHARDALALPVAAVRPSDLEVVETFLKELDEYAFKNMTRNGFVMEIDPRKFNPQIVLEVERRCRMLGWICDFQQRVKRSELDPKQQIVDGVQISMKPSDEAYREHHDRASIKLD